MNVLGSGSALNRRSIVIAVFAAVLGAAVSAHAQQAPAAGPPAPAEAPADPFKFTSDSGYIQFLVKPDKTADFESVWDTLFARLAASDKPELKAIAGSLRMFRLDKGPDAVPYLFVVDPVTKTQSYSISPFLLFESGLFTRAEGDELFAKVVAAVTGYGAQSVHKLH